MTPVRVAKAASTARTLDVLTRSCAHERAWGEHVSMDSPGLYEEMKTNYVESHKAPAELEDTARVGGNTHIHIL